MQPVYPQGGVYRLLFNAGLPGPFSTVLEAGASGVVPGYLAIDGRYRPLLQSAYYCAPLGTRYCRLVGQARAKTPVPPQDNIACRFDGRKEERGEGHA